MNGTPIERRTRMKKAKETRFEFSGNYHSELDLSCGKVKCDICEQRSKYIHVAIVLDDFLICPACLQSGPAAVAAELERIAGDKDHITRQWGYSDSSLDRVNISDMCRGYRKLAKLLRGLDSFEDLPGGKIALGVAEVLQAPAAGRKRRAA